MLKFMEILLFGNVISITFQCTKIVALQNENPDIFKE